VARAVDERASSVPTAIYSNLIKTDLLATSSAASARIEAMTEVIATLERWRDRGDEHAALATVVATRFSAPRPVGSRLGVSERGELAGSVSGGCVESEVALVAREVLASGEATTRTYGITDEQAGTVGLPCGGEIDVFVERVE
jgi:xanthine dehydrogenase accessory factor